MVRRCGRRNRRARVVPRRSRRHSHRNRKTSRLKGFIERGANPRPGQHIVRAARHRGCLRVRKKSRLYQYETAESHGLHRPRRSADVARMRGANQNNAYALQQVGLVNHAQIRVQYPPKPDNRGRLIPLPC